MLYSIHSSSEISPFEDKNRWRRKTGLKFSMEGWGSSSVAESLLGICKGLGLIPSIEKRNMENMQNVKKLNNKN
jgi:hypothetical protein